MAKDSLKRIGEMAYAFGYLRQSVKLIIRDLKAGKDRDKIIASLTKSLIYAEKKFGTKQKKLGNPYPKIVRCKICKKPIARLHRPASKEKILSVIRRHYKKYHPAKFHEWTNRG